ncbi:hypothetical protein RRG08_007854 [Elysia crispata]|uniref:Uncharacterized protein n=1 Tax=Elysia crispata TaxID=231223 RepID=A0AAE0XWN6_9GAST|nr:hypothetical protein RRG08_007854 [Elysia crispata]
MHESKLPNAGHFHKVTRALSCDGHRGDVVAAAGSSAANCSVAPVSDELSWQIDLQQIALWRLCLMSFCGRLICSNGLCGGQFLITALNDDFSAFGSFRIGHHIYDSPIFSGS